MAQVKSQTVRFGDKTVQIGTVIIDGIEYLRLKDVQRRFPSVTALCIGNVQLPFIIDQHGNDLEPLRVKAYKDRAIEALQPTTPPPDIDLQYQLNLIYERIIGLQITSDRIDANTQEILNQMRYVMTQMYELKEFTTPRYFFVLPAQRHDWAAINTVQNLFQVHYKLYFLCECSDEPKELHIAPHEGYSIKKPQEFIARYGSYLRTTLSVIKFLLALGSFVIPGLGNVSTVVGNPSFYKSSTALNDIKKSVKFVESLLDRTGTKLSRAVSSKLQNKKSQGAPLQCADLQELESYLQLVDSKRRLGSLYRIVTTEGHVRWVCLKHYDEISFNDKMFEYIRQLVTIGGQFNEEKKEAVIIQVNLTNKNIKMLCEALENGFNIAKLVFQKCSIYEGDLDILLDIIINRSSVQCLKITALDLYVPGMIRTSKYVCEYMILHFNNQSLKVRCHDHYQSGNAQVLTRILAQNKIHRTLDISACDFFGQEQELQRCLDANGMLTGLIVKYSNNVDVLNAISTLKNNTLHQLKLNYSLGLPSTSSRFCEILKNSQTLVEIDLMDFNGFTDETFITNLLSTLRDHKSIKHLSLHVCYVKPSNQKEDCLRDSLLNDTFIFRLCLSKSVISHQFTQALVHASQEYRSLTHLEFYDSQMNADDVSQLQSLYKNEALIHLIISKQPRWHSIHGETSDSLKKSK
jgi:hypothetical protein